MENGTAPGQVMKTMAVRPSGLEVPSTILLVVERLP
jgi:hypothetical protein